MPLIATIYIVQLHINGSWYRIYILFMIYRDGMGMDLYVMHLMSFVVTYIMCVYMQTFIEYALYVFSFVQECITK